MEKLTLKEAADTLGVMQLRLLELVELGAISPAVVDKIGGNIYDRGTVVLFTAADLEDARAVIDRRKFRHVIEQHGDVLAPDAAFYFGPGWEPILRDALTALAAIPAVKVTGGKEKFGAMVIHTAHDWTRTNDIKAIRETYHAASLATCEECGKPGRLIKGSPWKTCCDDHARLAGVLPE